MSISERKIYLLTGVSLIKSKELELKSQFKIIMKNSEGHVMFDHSSRYAFEAFSFLNHFIFFMNVNLVNEDSIGAVYKN